MLLLSILSVTAQDDTIRYSIPDEAIVTVTADGAAVLVLENTTPGAIITITARAVDDTQVDPVLWIVDSESRLIAYNHNTLTDTGLIDVSAEIANVVLPTTGLYSIYVDSFNGVQAGAVEVTIRESDRFNMVVETGDAAEVISFTLPEDTVFTYPFTVEGGDNYTITAYDGNGQLDPYLRIVDSRGNVIATNDDHSSHDLTLNIFDARITAWQVPSDDTYTLEVMDFLGRSGQMTLEIRKTG